MKIPWTFIQLLLAGSIMASNVNYCTIENASTFETTSFNRTIIKDRLSTMEGIVTPKYNPEVEAYLRSYLTYGYKDSERLLGRSVLYFPIFEHYLQLYGLPDELKYLPLIESSLRPYAVSTAGAVGLWQFMSPTARQYGLRIDRNVDERRDPYKATEAAVRYLAKLYDRFGSWELALAAYNCGGGRVNKAIRYAGSKDFWKVRAFLPRETRNYIPRFIAANYLANFYDLHDILPNFPAFELQWTRTMKVYEFVTFKEIIKVTGVKHAFLAELNPSYRNGFLPKNPNGNFLILPEMAMALFKSHLEDKYASDKNFAAPYAQRDYSKSNYVVLSGDTIEKLARLYNCSIQEIVNWNRLKSEELFYRQELVLYHLQTKPVFAARA